LASSGVTTGYVGPSGQQNLLAAYGNAAGVLPIGGHISTLYGVSDSLSSGSVTLTLWYNGTPTVISCALTSSNSTCTDTGTPVTVTAGATIAVLVTNNTGSYVRDIRWSTLVNP
jgi:hypothetical protein